MTDTIPCPAPLTQHEYGYVRAIEQDGESRFLVIEIPKGGDVPAIGDEAEIHWIAAESG